MSNASKHFVSSSSGKLRYTKYGTGKRKLLTFHGYGQSHQHLEPLNSLGDSFTIYHFDLPHHGDSTWHPGTAIEKAELRRVFDQFFETEGIDQFAMAAFSLGGKVLLSLLESYPKRIEVVILIAPDGIRSNSWYRMATMNSPSRWLFRNIAERPGLYGKTARIFRKTGLVDRSIARFVDAHMNTPEKRIQVYRVWTSYKKLRFKQRRVIGVLNDHQIPTYLYLGRYDRVIPERKFNRFRSVVRHIRYFSVESGHNHLIEQVGRRVPSDLDLI